MLFCPVHYLIPTLWLIITIIHNFSVTERVTRCFVRNSKFRKRFWLLDVSSSTLIVLDSSTSNSNEFVVLVVKFRLLWWESDIYCDYSNNMYKQKLPSFSALVICRVGEVSVPNFGRNSTSNNNEFAVLVVKFSLLWWESNSCCDYSNNMHKQKLLSIVPVVICRIVEVLVLNFDRNCTSNSNEFAVVVRKLCLLWLESNSCCDCSHNLYKHKLLSFVSIVICHVGEVSVLYIGRNSTSNSNKFAVLVVKFCLLWLFPKHVQTKPAIPSSRGLMKQYNQELCISLITRCFTKMLQSRPLKWKLLSFILFPLCKLSFSAQFR